MMREQKAISLYFIIRSYFIYLLSRNKYYSRNVMGKPDANI